MSDSKLITNTIFAYIYHQKCNLSPEHKRALAILINCDYKGCCGCKSPGNINYLLIEELMEIVNAKDCFEFANCGNRYCIHIINRFKIIDKLLPYYQFDEESLNGDNYFMFRYANSVPKEELNKIREDIMKELEG